MDKQCYNALKFKKWFTLNNQNSSQQQHYDFDQDGSYPCFKGWGGGGRKKKQREKREREKVRGEPLRLKGRVANSLFVLSKMYQEWLEARVCQ